MSDLGLRLRRMRRPGPYITDALLALVLVATALSHVNLADRRQQAAALFLMTVAVAFRRRQALATLGLVIAGWLWALAISPNWPPWSAASAFAALLIATYSVATHARRGLVGLAAVLAAATIAEAMTSTKGRLPLPGSLLPYLVLGAIWLVGRSLRNRQLLALTWEGRATKLEEEQEATQHAALAEERARIARELHDMVTHSVSLMVIQAGAARQVLDDPEHVASVLRSVESAGRDALNELRRLLGVLANRDEKAPLEPRPGLNELEALVDRVGKAGLPVILTVRGQERPLPPGLDLAAYRIIQEALTNSLKHSACAATEVVVDYQERELAIEVHDEGPAVSAAHANGAGHGLVGMRERAAIYGGTVEARPDADRGYTVRASLPLEQARP